MHMTATSEKKADAGGGTPPASDQCRAPTRHCHPVVSLVKHDVRGKMVSIFPDHALAGDDQIDRLRTFALFIRLDIEADALALDQRLQPRTLYSGDVHEHVATPVVWFDEPVSA